MEKYNGSIVGLSLMKLACFLLLAPSGPWEELEMLSSCYLIKSPNFFSIDFWLTTMWQAFATDLAWGWSNSWHLCDLARPLWNLRSGWMWDSVKTGVIYTVECFLSNSHFCSFFIPFVFLTTYRLFHIAEAWLLTFPKLHHLQLYPPPVGWLYYLKL